MSVLSKSWELPSLPPTAEVAEAFAYCERFARAHYENFPVGSLLVPRSKRPHVYSIYAFARIADDYADEGDETSSSSADRLAALDEWERQLEDCFRREATHPVFIALAATVEQLQLPITLLRDLISAFRQDVVKRRYRDFREVQDYCVRSANPVGRLILLLFDYRDPHLHTLSDHICTGLQLANFWQDVAVDIDKDRIYLPQDEMADFGVTEDDLHGRHFSAAYAALLEFQVGRTREMFVRGRPLPELVSGRLRHELRLTWLGGMRILERIAQSGYNTLSERPTITMGDKVGLLARAFLNRL